MDKKAPSPRERQVLTLIRRFSSEFNNPPTTDVLAAIFLREILWQVDVDEVVQDAAEMHKELKSAHKNVLNIINRLESKGLAYRIGNSVNLTSAAEDYFFRFDETVNISSNLGIIPAQIQVKGHVRAGPGDDLDVGFAFDTTESLAVPSINKGRKVYALKVDGSSMEYEGILDGDYVIVEEFSASRGPREDDIVIAKYIELNEQAMDDYDLESEDWHLIGHTLKRFKEEIKGSQRYVRLSRLQNPDSNPYLIKAARITFVGKVVGLYRRYPK